MKLNVYSTRVT